MRSVNELAGFINNNRGVAVGNRYRVILPTDFNITQADAKTLDLFCNAVNLPGRQILTVDRQIGPSFQKMAYGYLSDDVNLSFMLTNRPVVKQYFEQWQQMAVASSQQDGVHHPRYKTEYARDVTIDHLDKNGEMVYSVTLIKAFPTTVSAVQLGNETIDRVQLDVQLSYTRWYVNGDE